MDIMILMIKAFTSLMIILFVFLVGYVYLVNCKDKTSKFGVGLMLVVYLLALFCMWR